MFFLKLNKEIQKPEVDTVDIFHMPSRNLTQVSVCRFDLIYLTLATKDYDSNFSLY